MTVIELCQQLLPGDLEAGINGFSAEHLAAFKARFPDTFTTIEACLSQFRETAAEKNRAQWGEEFMLYLRKDNPLLHRQFRLELLTLYLTDSALLKKLGLPSQPLYPQGQSLDNINYDLLEPVYERGPIWHKID